MATWQDFEHEAPDLAPAVRARFEANKHHVLATLRKDGSPRVSGTEVDFIGADLMLGSMGGAVKAADLRRDARFALHSNPSDETLAGGDSKVSGRAVELTDAAEVAAYEADLPEPPSGPYHAFRLELEQVVHTTVEDDAVRISSWRPGEPVRTVERR
ncbi:MULTISPECIES: pyridoxamine 5'-phosphate oxidase family protein [unclassified Streptomyces]|uniref:pyridoxamine 5'-phosphate oxidase family protein n=1 Tax=Streptomycetaceae TaxID=2062 RepID=UPI002E77A2BF|nr:MULTISPECIES: pyridoxamine 5'-phosphate oxidase family protein [unclassified Streptomyces]MED7951009.1 pyridoxamine 5'-phosphate oxidase family protein [Streptomyces sp. BE303]MEE1825534.1 pyridoxamine 5'-phosphate oxidase family protein [Streptomyces sp. BE20]